MADAAENLRYEIVLLGADLLVDLECGKQLKVTGRTSKQRMKWEGNDRHMRSVWDTRM